MQFEIFEKKLLMILFEQLKTKNNQDLKIEKKGKIKKIIAKFCFAKRKQNLIKKINSDILKTGINRRSKKLKSFKLK